MRTTEASFQPNHDEPAYEDDVHYVSFVMSDGDNKGWILQHFPTKEDQYASPFRGQVTVGWTMPPVLVELAPTALAWIYRNASTGPGKDSFIAGVSGSGYMYPDKYPDLAGHTDRLAIHLAKADINVVNIMVYQQSGFTAEVAAQYTRLEQVKGALAINYSFGYERLDGKLIWTHDKPALGAMYAMCDECSIEPMNAEQVVAEVNTRPIDPLSADGYTFVIVNPFDFGPADLKSAVDTLDDNVRVVTPEELIDAMIHFRPE